MNAHYAPLSDALAPVLCTATAAMDAFDAQVESLGPLPAGNASLCDLERGRSRVDGVGNTFSCPAPSDGLYGPKSQPPELASFVRSHSSRAVAAALGVGQGTVTRLRGGYWPADPRKIVQAWNAYKGQTVKRSTSWFLRRVSADGVRHGGKFYSSPYLAGREGELIAVARSAEGDFLAVSLELPTERFLLGRV